MYRCTRLADPSYLACAGSGQQYNCAHSKSLRCRVCARRSSRSDERRSKQRYCTSHARQPSYLGVYPPKASCGFRLFPNQDQLGLGWPLTTALTGLAIKPAGTPPYAGLNSTRTTEHSQHLNSLSTSKYSGIEEIGIACLVATEQVPKWKRARVVETIGLRLRVLPEALQAWKVVFS